jgi:hypothetical protein
MTQPPLFPLRLQHIEDLTQEKFALQRGAEAARALAASLEEENSRLTEDFNRQAQAVQALKAELERQQAEITAQQVLSGLQCVVPLVTLHRGLLSKLLGFEGAALHPARRLSNHLAFLKRGTACIIASRLTSKACRSL